MWFVVGRQTCPPPSVPARASRVYVQGTEQMYGLVNMSHRTRSTVKRSLYGTMQCSNVKYSISRWNTAFQR